MSLYNIDVLHSFFWLHLSCGQRKCAYWTARQSFMSRMFQWAAPRLSPTSMLSSSTLFQFLTRTTSMHDNFNTKARCWMYIPRWRLTPSWRSCKQSWPPITRTSRGLRARAVAPRPGLWSAYSKTPKMPYRRPRTALPCRHWTSLPRRQQPPRGRSFQLLLLNGPPAQPERRLDGPGRIDGADAD